MKQYPFLDKEKSESTIDMTGIRTWPISAVSRKGQLEAGDSLMKTLNFLSTIQHSSPSKKAIDEFSHCNSHNISTSQIPSQKTFIVRKQRPKTAFGQKRKSLSHNPSLSISTDTKNSAEYSKSSKSRIPKKNVSSPTVTFGHWNHSISKAMTQDVRKKVSFLRDC